MASEAGLADAGRAPASWAVTVRIGDRPGRNLADNLPATWPSEGRAGDDQLSAWGTHGWSEWWMEHRPANHGSRWL
jgi:hypothetical protein